MLRWVDKGRRLFSQIPVEMFIRTVPFVLLEIFFGRC